MNIPEFLKTIYVGDRGCKAVEIDGWASEARIQVTCISRVKGESWNYYGDEDLVDGFIVFEGVTSVGFRPDGVIPNDTINDISAVPSGNDVGRYIVTVRVDSVGPQGDRTEVEISIHAASMALADSSRQVVAR